MAVNEAKRGRDLSLKSPNTFSISSLCVGAAVDAGPASGEGKDEIRDAHVAWRLLGRGDECRHLERSASADCNPAPDIRDLGRNLE